MARDWRNQYYFRSWSQFQQIFWLLSSDKVTLTSCNSAEPSQGVFSLNGQKQQQTCFLFLRILNKKWGRDALWKLEKRNFDVHHFIRHFIFLCWIITVKCLRVVVLSVSMFCVCTKRGRALPPPIVTHHPAWHAEIQIIWPGTVGLTLAWPSVAALCWLGASVTSTGVWRSRDGAPVSATLRPPCPGDNRGEMSARQRCGQSGNFWEWSVRIFTPGSHSVTTLQHRNSVTERPDSWWSS